MCYDFNSVPCATSTSKYILTSLFVIIGVSLSESIWFLDWTFVQSNYLFSSMTKNPNAGIPRLINAKAFTAGCIKAKPVAIRVGNVAHIEKSFLSLCTTLGKYLLGKNIQKPAMYTHKIDNSSNSWPIAYMHKISYNAT